MACLAAVLRFGGWNDEDKWGEKSKESFIPFCGGRLLLMVLLYVVIMMYFNFANKFYVGGRMHII